MTTSFYLVLGLIGCFAFAVWLALRNAREAGRVGAESEARSITIENAKQRTLSDDEIARMDPEQRRRRLAEWVSGDDQR